MMIRFLFSLLISLTLVGLPIAVGAEENTSSDSSTSQDDTSREAAKKAAELKQATTKATAESVRKQLTSEKAARLAAIDAFKAEKDKTKQLAKIKEVALKLLAERNKAITQLNDLGQTKKCGVAAKADVKAALDAATARLKAMEPSITNAKTVEEVKTLISGTLVAKNHVFVILIPAVRGMCTADNLISQIDNNITPAVTKLKTAGSDTTAIEARLTTAKAAAQAAYNLYEKAALTPTDRTVLVSAKAKLKEARAELAAAKDGLKALVGSGSPETKETPKVIE